MEWAKSEDNSLTHVSFSSPGGAIDRRYWRHRGEVYRLRLHLLLLRFGRDANYWTSVSVCLSDRLSEKRRPNFTKVSVHVTDGRGLMLL